MPGYNDRRMSETSTAYRMKLVADAKEGKRAEKMRELLGKWLQFIESEAEKGDYSVQSNHTGAPIWDKALIPLLQEEGFKVDYWAGDQREPMDFPYHTIKWY